MNEKFQLFLMSWQIWGGAVLAGVAAGTVCGFLGVYVILHRIVFVSAAMSQVSSLGVMIAFWLAQFALLENAHPFEDVLPLSFAALFTGVFAAAMAKRSSSRTAGQLSGPGSKSSEAFIGSVYLMATAGLLLVGDRVTRGAHDVSDVLFGNAVAVDVPHLILLLSVCIPFFLIHIVLKKDILFISFDPVVAQTMGYPVRFLRVFLLVSLGIIISIGTRTIGALPVFSFSVLPAMAGLALFNDLKWSFVSASLLGALSALLGYLISFLFSFPTGACMTATAGIFLLLAKLISSAREARS